MNSEINALLGKGSEFEGKLTFEGTVRIDGRFTGEVLSDGTLIVGEGAEVEAEIRVAQVMVYGDVKGNITATGAVELHAPASLRGNITSPSLHIDKGVYFDGACQMIGEREDAAPPLPRRPPVPTPQAVPAVGGDVPPGAPPSAQQAARKISGLYQTTTQRPAELKHKF